jgi:PhoPQ-activated pathogenicity-related protein
MMIHCGKTDAMFDYLDRVNISYIMTKGSQKDYRATNNGSLSISQLPQASPLERPPNSLHLHQMGTLGSSFLDHLNNEASKEE